MKKLLFIPLMLISFLNYSQSLDSMKYVHRISYIKPSENIFEKQEKLRQNILSNVSKISKQKYLFNLDRYKRIPSLLHPDTQRQQLILNPNNANDPVEAIFLGIIRGRYY